MSSASTSASTAASASAPAPATTARRQQAGSRLLIPVLAFTALTVAYVIVNNSTPRPDASGAEVLRYAAAHATGIKAGSWLLFGSAAPLAVLAGVFYRRLRALGIAAPGSAITLVGGVLGSSALAIGAMLAWAGGRLPADASPALARALADLSFLSGGVFYAVMFGLLVAGISVSGLLARLLPKPLAWAGLVVAAAGVVSSLTLLADPFAYLLPVVRFGGLVWLIVVAVKLPRTRPRRHQP